MKMFIYKCQILYHILYYNDMLDYNTNILLKKLHFNKILNKALIYLSDAQAATPKLS